MQPAIRSDRRHRFDVDAPTLWSALARTDEYRHWWPWLRRLEGAAFEVGTTWRCEVQPPLPYSLHFDLTIEEVEAPRNITATIRGDISGHAGLDVVGVAGGGSELHLVSTLGPESSVLQLISRFAAPIVRFGHDWVLDTGLRQFQRQAFADRGEDGGMEVGSNG